jgi:hypothetical protein
MSSMVEHQARQHGPTIFNVHSVAADLQVVSSPDAGSAWVELTALDGDDNAIQAIRQAKFSERGGEVFLELDEGGVAGGRQSNVFQSVGDVSIGVAGGRIFVNGGSMINGVTMGRILIRAILPTGSAVDANSTSGDVETRGIGQVDARTVSGDITAVGLTKDSNLNTVSGDVTVSAVGWNERGARIASEVALPGEGPRIRASTVSGDVTGYGVQLRASTVSGEVRQR